MLQTLHWQPKLPTFFVTNLILTLSDFSSPPFLLSSSLTPICVCQPPFHSSSLPFYSLPLVETQMITSPPYPTRPPLLPRIPHKLAHSKNSLETCSKCQTAFGNEFPHGTNSVQLSTLYLTIESLSSLAHLLTSGPAQFNNNKLSPSTGPMFIYYGYWAAPIPMGMGQLWSSTLHPYNYYAPIIKSRRWKSEVILYFSSYPHFLPSFHPNLESEKLKKEKWQALVKNSIYLIFFSPFLLQSNNEKLQFSLHFPSFFIL